MPQLKPFAIAIASPLSALLLAASAHAQIDFAAVEIVPHHVAGSVYYLEGAGGNIGLSVGEDGYRHQ